MYRLVQGTSLEDLFNHSLKNHSDWWAPAFISGKRTLIIVQNQNVIRWIQIRLSGALGACGGLDIRIPDQALRGLLEVLDWEKMHRKKPALLFMDSLKLLILHHMEKILQAGSEKWDPLRTFLGDGTEAGSRLYGLANALAGSFSHYAQNEISIPQAWRAGKPAVPLHHPAQAQEEWQKELWQKCFPHAEGPRLLGSLLEELMELTGSGGRRLEFLPGKAWDRILILGSPFLSRQALAFLASLGNSSGREVLHYLLVPSGPDDLPSQDLQEPQAGWSRLYRGFREEAVRYTGEILNLPPSDPSPGSLGLVQQRLRGIPCDFSSADPGKKSNLEFIACTTPRRQLEVLKDRLTILLQDGTLSPQDIAVMAPDLSVFAPLVETVFQEETAGPLPHNLQVPDSGYASRLTALRLLLSLGTGRLTRKEVLELCRHPLWAGHNGLDREELTSLENFLENTHTFWAWDENHRLEVLPGYPGGENTWSRAQDRLALSLAYGREERLVPGLQGDDIPAPSESPGVHARILLMVQDLRTRMKTFSGLSLPVGEWCRKLQLLAEDHLGPFRAEEGSPARDDLETVFQRLQSLAGELPEDIQARVWSWELFFQMFQDQADRLEPGPGAFLIRGIIFFPFRPLRTLPFKVIALLGMDEGAFPGMDSPPSFDLRSRERTPIDQESTDLFSFLETIMAAKDRLLIFWRGRDEVSGEERPPAAPVQDLLDILEEQTGHNYKKFIRTAPVNSWSPVNFLSGDNLPDIPGTSPRGLETARILAGGPREPSLPGASRLARSGEVNLGIQSPGRYTELLTASVRFALQTGAGIWFEDEKETRETENFSLDFFHTRDYYRCVLETLPESASSPPGEPRTSPEDLLERWSIQGEWGNRSLKEWEKKELMEGGRRLKDLLTAWISPGSLLKAADLESLEGSAMKGRITWMETPTGQVILPWPVGSRLDKNDPGEVPLKHRIGALMGWTGLLAGGGAPEPPHLKVLFYHGAKGQITEWSPAGDIFYSRSRAGEFLAALQKLALDMIRSPFPLYPALMEPLLKKQEGCISADELAEAWEQWSENNFQKKTLDDRGESPLRRLLDRPGTCPYLKAAWEDDPPWETLAPRIEEAVRGFILPFIPEKEEQR